MLNDFTFHENIKTLFMTNSIRFVNEKIKRKYNKIILLFV
jgi:alcohol dehydrogenase YqhD (iron-dependent ADH family)